MTPLASTVGTWPSTVTPVVTGGLKVRSAALPTPSTIVAPPARVIEEVVMSMPSASTSVPVTTCRNVTTVVPLPLRYAATVGVPPMVNAS